MAIDSTAGTAITMPKLGESVTEGTIGTWLKAVGDTIDKYEPLVEVVTDKVNAEIPAPVGGILRTILIEPDTTVPVGTPICVIDEATTDVAIEPAATDQTPPTTSLPAGDGTEVVPPSRARSGGSPTGPQDEASLLRTRSSPVVRRIAEEHGIALESVDGTGIHGRVTKQDLLRHVAGRSPAEPATAAAPIPSATSPVRIDDVSPAISPLDLQPGDESIPLSPMRRAVAEHMVRSERTAPHVTVVMEVDMTGIVALRDRHRAAFRQREGVDLTFLPFAIKAATFALRDHPRLNSAWDEAGGRIIQRGAINVGMAVGLDDGLIVPVIRHADRLSVTGLAHVVTELAARARAGTLGVDDLAGGTFTINNPGTFGSIVSTPILVQPQAAILSTEAVVKRPVVIDEMIAIRSMMHLSLSIDHRVLDGLAAARFLQAVKRWLEAITPDTAIA